VLRFLRRSTLSLALLGSGLLGLHAQAAEPLSGATASNPPPAVPAPVGGAASAWPWMEGWSGATITNHSFAFWMGAVIALNKSRNIWATGPVVRLEAMVGRYNYLTGNLPSGRSVVPTQSGAIMVGYRKVSGRTIVTGYAGIVLDNNRNKDPFASVSGTKFGFRVLGEVYSRLSDRQDVYAQASFATAFRKWNVLVRPGFLFRPNVWLGPEFQVFGNKGAQGNGAYVESRIGGFLQLKLDNRALSSIIVSAGYLKPIISNSDRDGYYVQIGANYRF